MKYTTTTRYRMIILVLASLAMAATGFSAAAGDTTSAEDIKQETAELLEALKAYSTEQRDAAVEQSRAALQNLDQWDQMDQATRARTRASLQALREQRTRVAEWYGSLKSSSAEAWGHIKQGFSEAYRTLNENWQKSEVEIGNSERR
jgi:hypothetical protein